MPSRPTACLVDGVPRGEVGPHGTALLVATDPQGIENSRLRHPQLTYSTSIDETLCGADAVVLVTEWAEFKQVDLVEFG